MKVKNSILKKASISDKIIRCVDCRKDFVFSTEEQTFFQKKGWNDPIRCKDCRRRRANGKKYIGLNSITGKMGAQKSVLFDHAQTYGPSHCVNVESFYSFDDSDDGE